MQFNPNDSLGKQCVAEIRRNMQLQTMNASGDTSRALEYEESPGHLRVFFNNPNHAPAYSLQHGSGPHFNSQPEGFVEAIIRWVRVKPGFRPSGGNADAAYNRAAWAIVTKIRRYGTNRFGGFTDIWTSVYNDAVVEFGKRYAIYVKQQISDALR